MNGSMNKALADWVRDYNAPDIETFWHIREFLTPVYQGGQKGNLIELKRKD